MSMICTIYIIQIHDNITIIHINIIAIHVKRDISYRINNTLHNNIITYIHNNICIYIYILMLIYIYIYMHIYIYVSTFGSSCSRRAASPELLSSAPGRGPLYIYIYI